MCKQKWSTKISQWENARAKICKLLVCLLTILVNQNEPIRNAWPNVCLFTFSANEKMLDQNYARANYCLFTFTCLFTYHYGRPKWANEKCVSKKKWSIKISQWENVEQKSVPANFLLSLCNDLYSSIHHSVFQSVNFGGTNLYC